MFNPGETIAHQFIIPFVSTEISKVVVSYKQGDDIIIEKTVTSGFESIRGGTHTQFILIFSQQESLTFGEHQDYMVQVNVLTTAGSRATSKEIRGKNGAQYHKEVITP